MGLDLKNIFDYSENAVQGTMSKDSVSSLDLKITEDNVYLNGGEILYQDAVWGDYITMQVVDIDNVLGYGANTVLKEYIHKRYIHPELKSDEVCLPYAGMAPKNTYLRLKYTSVGTTNDVKVAANYYLHEME